MNGVLLCSNCHTWAEEHEAEFLGWLKTKFPPLWAWHKENAYPNVKRYAEWEIKDVCKGLRQMIRKFT